MTTFTFEDGTVLRAGDILKFNPETGKVHVEKPPQWTSTLPTESGRYWLRMSGPGGEPEIVKIEVTKLHDGETLWSCFAFGNEIWLYSYEISSEAEWWPIPLTAPE